jgi:hypothetical protein
VAVAVEEVEEEVPVTKPFPYIVPIVAKSCSVLLDETERCTKVIKSTHGYDRGEEWRG